MNLTVKITRKKNPRKTTLLTKIMRKIPMKVIKIPTKILKILMETRMKIPTKIRKACTKVIIREVCTQALKSSPTKTGLNLKVTKTPTKILKIPTKTQKIRTRTRKEIRMERATTESTEIRNSTIGKTTRRSSKILKMRWN